MLKGKKGSHAGRLLGFMRCKYIATHRRSRPLSKSPIRILPLLDHQISMVLREVGYFLFSSNGLVLCGFHTMTYRIKNTLTKKLGSCSHLAMNISTYQSDCLQRKYNRIGGKLQSCANWQTSYDWCGQQIDDRNLLLKLKKVGWINTCRHRFSFMVIYDVLLCIMVYFIG